MGEQFFKCLKLDQIDKATDLIENRDRLVNIYKHSTENRVIDIKESKLITQILKQDEDIIMNLEKVKSETKTRRAMLSNNKNKIDRYRQVT